jgi:site-specific DNA-adenine methylase
MSKPIIPWIGGKRKLADHFCGQLDMSLKSYRKSSWAA